MYRFVDLLVWSSATAMTAEIVSYEISKFREQCRSMDVIGHIETAHISIENLITHRDIYREVDGRPCSPLHTSCRAHIAAPYAMP